MSEQARLDLQRRQRLGMVEAVWGEHKTAAQIAPILVRLQANGEPALATRVDATKAAAVAELLAAEPTTAHLGPALRHHPDARGLSLGDPLPPRPELGRVVVLSGGTSDLPVAAEAQLALHWHGIASELLLDVGVAGLHRLLQQLERLQEARVLIACAGMEGAGECGVRRQRRRPSGPARHARQLRPGAHRGEHRQRLRRSHGRPAHPPHGPVGRGP
jgi:NCAIR mutase (PurE)-related protein